MRAVALSFGPADFSSAKINSSRLSLLEDLHLADWSVISEYLNTGTARICLQGKEECDALMLGSFVLKLQQSPCFEGRESQYHTYVASDTTLHAAITALKSFKLPAGCYRRAAASAPIELQAKVNKALKSIESTKLTETVESIMSDW